MSRSARLFASHLRGHTQGLEDLAIEMLARGLSVRDIEDAFRDENGRLLLSKTAGSQLGSGCGRITRRSPSATWVSTKSFICLLTASPSACGLAPNANRFWRPGALPSKVAACCCT